MSTATVTVQLAPSPQTVAALDERKPANANEAHTILGREFDRRADEARALLAREMKGWRLSKPDLTMFVTFKSGNYMLGYQQAFEK